MILQERIQIMCELGDYMRSQHPEWEAVQERASRENTWFIAPFVKDAIGAITRQMLTAPKLAAWVSAYSLPENTPHPKKVGLVMAGNIPLVGFFDCLCIFISGHTAIIKPSSSDSCLILHLIEWLKNRDSRMETYFQIAERLKGCDAYIATGSNQSGRYFDYYFGKHPHIIRRNRTSVAVLNGQESPETLQLLARDMQQYFGLGCRNVTQIWVPEGYSFEPLLEALKSYDFLMDLPAYKHNYDYHLTLLIMSNRYYMTNGSVVLTENASPFSPVSHVHYQFYQPGKFPETELKNNSEIQCIVGRNGIAPGMAQNPGLSDYADGVDTMAFLTAL
ncbi:MAG: acyl-CoA reductase [Sediminibacterium sp.]|nr:acyl-CoA reductase [Sediminibacterium sp.]